MVSAWPGPPFARHAAITAGVHDGMAALACATITTESPFFFNSIGGLKQKRDRHVGFVDRAEHSAVRAMRDPGARFGKHLGPCFDALSFWAKKGDRCLWLGTASIYEPRGTGSRQP